MKGYFAAAAIAASVSGAFADNCASGSSQDALGNYYCSAVSGITYQNVGGAGSYNKITNMDSSSGACSSAPYGYSGSYNKMAEREAADMVTATINGQVVSWTNDYYGPGGSPATPAAQPASSSAAAAAPQIQPQSFGSNPIQGNPSDYSAGDWVQKGYYNAAAGKSDGIVFLNHNGGNNSGTFDYVFGNSLSYATSDGCWGASSPEVLADATLPSNTEIVIMTDQKCDGDCGYVRDGTVAYHGFSGDQKAFIAEFEMPHDSENQDRWTNGDMPAIWTLNAQIPNTLQYGQADCSCHITGCGEFDIFEVLAPGENRAKSTLHGNKAGGDSDYFNRPSSGKITVATIFSGNDIHIKVLDNPFDFGDCMTGNLVSDLVNSVSSASGSVSLFTPGAGDAGTP